jgi:hypothetical protein
MNEGLISTYMGKTETMSKGMTRFERIMKKSISRFRNLNLIILRIESKNRLTRNRRGLEGFVLWEVKMFLEF